MKRKVNSLQGFKKGGKKQDWVSEKISMLMKEGRPQDQAIAMALSMWSQKHEEGGYQLPMYQKGTSGTIDPNYSFSNALSGENPFSSNTGYPKEMGLSAANPNDEYQKFFASKLEESKDMESSMNGSTQDKNREEAKNTLTSWQTPQLYGGKDIASSAYSFGNYAKNKDVPGMVFSALNTALPLVRAGAAGYATENRNNYIQKSFSENLKDAFTGKGSEEALGANGGYYSQGAILPMYQDGDIYGDQEGYSNDLIDKYARSNAYPMNQQDVDSYGSDNIYGDQEGYKNDLIDKYARPKAYPTNQQEAYQEQIDSQKGYVTPTIDPNSARDVWTAKTGLSWADAKKRGYTDGSASGNKALLERFKNESVANILENKPSRAKNRVAKATEKRAQPTPAPYTDQQAAADYAAYRKQNPATKRDTGKITASEEGNMITRAGEILANPIQSFGHLAKYGEMPSEGFSKNSKNAYDQVIGLANPIYWANALGNAGDYASEGEYKKAAFEALDALPALGKIKYVRYLPLDKANKLVIEKAIPLLSKKGALTAAEKAIVYEAKTISDVAIRQAAKPITGMAKYYPKGANQIGQGPLNYYYDPLQLSSGARQLGSGAPQLSQGAKQLAQGTKRLGFENGGYYQEGGMQPGMEEGMEGQMSNPQEEGTEQQGGDQMQQVMQEVSQALEQGADPQQILQQLVQMGVPQEQATQMIQAIMSQSQPTPQLAFGGEMMKRADGSYSERGMWDNIRDNAGSGKKPTKEMLEQEREIRSKYEDGGTIPERYRNMGFNQVGVKKQSTSPGKKWMVLAKKGDEYKVVHGGADGMEDFKQHGSEERRDRFWDRMGGKDSAKANDPFSPLYWHKKFGTWQEGGEMMDEQMGGQEQAEGDQMQQVVETVSGMLQQGADPQQVVDQLVQMGMPQDQAMQLVQQVMQMMQQGAEPQQQQQQQAPQMQNGGEYLSKLRGKTIKNYTYNSKTGNYDVEFE